MTSEGARRVAWVIHQPVLMESMGCKALYLEQNLWYNVFYEELMSGAEQASWK
jgi:hypothetical protein